MKRPSFDDEWMMALEVAALLMFLAVLGVVSIALLEMVETLAV